MLALPKPASRPNACARGELVWTVNEASRPKVAVPSELGVNTPKLKPCRFGAVLKRFRPACLSTRLLNSTIFTSTCTLWLFTFTLERSTSSALSGWFANAPARAAWCSATEGNEPCSTAVPRCTSMR